MKDGKSQQEPNSAKGGLFIKQKVKNNLLLRIILEIVVGNIISTVLCFIFIFIGYFRAYSDELTAYTVRFFQFPIYEITKTGEQMAGTPLGQNMLVIGIICSAICIIVFETVHFVQAKKQY